MNKSFLIKSLAILCMVTGSINSDSKPEPLYPFDTDVIKGSAIFLENPEVCINGIEVRCKCGEPPYVVRLDYGCVEAYCDQHAPTEKRSSCFNWSMFPWSKDE